MILLREAACSLRCDTYPSSAATWRGQRGAEPSLLSPFQRGSWARWLPSVDPVPHPKGLGVEGHNEPCTGRLAKATVTPLGADQRPVALSEALPVLMLQKCRASLLASPAILQPLYPEVRPSLGEQSALYHFPSRQQPGPCFQAAPFLSSLMTICFMSSLPPCPVPRLSLYSRAVSLDAAFFPITSCLIQTFRKAPFQALQLPQCGSWLGWTEAPPLSSEGAALASLPHPIRGVTKHILISKATPCTSATNPSRKQTRYPPSTINK